MVQPSFPLNLKSFRRHLFVVAGGVVGSPYGACTATSPGLCRASSGPQTLGVCYFVQDSECVGDSPDYDCITVASSTACTQNFRSNVPNPGICDGSGYCGARYFASVRCVRSKTSLSFEKPGACVHSVPWILRMRPVLIFDVAVLCTLFLSE